MKVSKLLISLLLFPILSAHSVSISIKADELLLFSSGVGESFSHYVVNKNDLSKIGFWDGTGDPPLDSNQAIEIALIEHANLYGEVDSTIKSASMESKKTYCTDEMECQDLLWYYKIRVRGDESGTYVVFMNGNLLVPRVD